MLFLANPSTPKVRDAMTHWQTTHLGMIATPAQGNPLMLGVPWCADNGIFGGAYPGDQEYLDWLAHWPLWAARTCLFAVAPDVVGDAAATLDQSAPMLPRIREYGIPAGIVFGFPVTTENGEYKIVEGLAIDAFSQECIDKTLAELQGEQDGVKHLL